MKTRRISSALATHGRKSCYWSAVAVAAMLMSACATPQSQDRSGAGLTAVAPIATRPDGGVRLDTTNQEVARLWAAAERARAENKPVISLELLYEAMEIDPQNALLWSRAAEHKLDALEPALAENYATRSNTFANENRPLLHRNWLIIEHARSMRGDLLGERSAHKQVQFYQHQ